MPSEEGKEITIRHGTSFNKFNLGDKDTVFILDEGDEYLKNHAIEFDGVEPSGLNALRDHQVYLVTATLDELSKRII